MPRPTYHPLLAAALAALLASCGEPLTQVLIVIDTDLPVPDALDEVRVDLIGPDGSLKRSEGRLSSASDLPRTLAVVHRGGALGPVSVTVTGLVGGRNVVQRRASFYFVEGEVRVLRMDLVAACVGVACGLDETCGPNGCRSLAVDEGELVPYDEAAVGRRDGGAFDGSLPDGGGECVPRIETCDGIDDDCDGRTDEDFDVTMDRRHCGACGNACPSNPPNASSACESSACVLRCDPGFADCNRDDADGCEAALDEPAHCGSCENACGGTTAYCEEGTSGFGCVATCSMGTELCGGSCVSLASSPRHCGSCGNACADAPNAAPVCMGGVCGILCDTGFGDCNGDPADGCESDLRELTHCGACGVRCERPGAITSCTTGTCVMVGCEPLRGDCDGDPANGCETDLSSDPSRCGACANMCPADPANGSIACTAGACTLTCDPGFGDCDGDRANGCEASLSSATSCGACGVVCADPTPVCTASGGGYVCDTGCGGTVCGSSCVDTSTDVSHCGGCDMACSAGEHAAPTCSDGQCGVTCDAGWADCDEDRRSCEVAISTDVRNCGRCGNRCPNRDNATATCTAGTCGFTCDVGWADCDGRAGNGCEVDTRTSATHCGACGNVCAPGPNVASVGCEASVCTIESCTEGWGDCDANAANGCEVDTSANRDHCGACGTSCGGGTACCSGTCTGPPPHCP